jgi:hypothetical protein
MSRKICIRNSSHRENAFASKLHDILFEFDTYMHVDEDPNNG